MTLQRSHLGLVIILSILTVVAVFLGNQRDAYADSLGEDLVCLTYQQLQAAGAPIPPELEAQCGGGNGGGGDTGGDTGGGGGDTPVDPCDIFDELGSLPPECDDDGGTGGETSTDVCPNIEGDQAQVPDGMVIVDGNCVEDTTGGGDTGGGDTGGGGTGGGDTGGGSSGGSSGSGGSGGCPPYANPCTDGTLPGATTGGGEVLGTTTAATSTGEVIGETTSEEATTTPEVISCDMYINEFIKEGADNSPEQVTRLQTVLNMSEGADLEMTGVYDIPTVRAVLEMQQKYASDVLTPWGITEPTGFVYLTTRKKLNELYCEGMRQFPLSEEELSIINASRQIPSSAPTAAATQTNTNVVKDSNGATDEKKEDTKNEDSAVDLPGGGVSNFIRGFFDRFR